MKNLYLTIIVLIISLSANSQNIASKLGGSVSAIYFETDYGRLPGVGLMLENRLEFKDSKFEIKNNLGVEIINNLETKYARHFLYKFGALAEYNFFRFGTINRFGEIWTPYVGFGAEAIYYHTAVYDENPYEEELDYKNGTAFNLKGTIGAKYKMSRNIIVNAEFAFDYNLSGEIDGNSSGDKQNHSSMITIGLAYQIF